MLQQPLFSDIMNRHEIIGPSTNAAQTVEISDEVRSVNVTISVHIESEIF